MIVEYKHRLEKLLSCAVVDSVRSRMSIGSSWGRADRPFHEGIGESFTVDSRAWLLRSEARPLNVPYALLSTVWIVLGKNDVEPLVAFNSLGSQLTVDGFTLSGAFGHRLRTLDGDQLEGVIRILQQDRSSRRGVAMIGRPADISEETKDFPCASLMQFFVRDGALHAVVYMRSQSFFGVFPYDLVNFRYIQEYMAWRLGVASARLTFTFGSLHVYVSERQRIEQFLREDSNFDVAPQLSWGSLAEQFTFWTETADGRAELLSYSRGASFP